MNIKTEFQSYGWVAVDDDTYDGPGSDIGIGRTEQQAVDDLREKMAERIPRNTAVDEVLLARARDLLYQVQGSLGWIGSMNSDILRQQIKTFLEDTKQTPQVLAECEECERIIVSPLRRFPDVKSR